MQPLQQHPGSMIDIRPGFFPLAFLLFFCRPHFSINRAAPVTGRWGENQVPVPPGRYEVTVWVRYLFFSQMGISSIVVDVPHGACAVVTWRAPFTTFGTGRIAVGELSALPSGSAGPGPGQLPAHRNPEQEQPRSAPGGWHQDPSGRHQLRYYDGARWTEHVSDNGAQASDPL